MSLRRVALPVGLGDGEVRLGGVLDVDLVTELVDGGLDLLGAPGTAGVDHPLDLGDEIDDVARLALEGFGELLDAVVDVGLLGLANEVVAEAAVELALRVGPLDDLGERAGGVALLAPRLEAVEHDVADVDDGVGLPDRVERAAELEDLAIVVPLGAPLRTPGLDGPAGSRW